MSILSYKDESLNQLNTDESKLKNQQKKMINYNIINNRLNVNNDLSINSKNNLNKSISGSIKNKKLDVSNRTDGNMLNDYLHSHKFGIQRKKTRRATFRTPGKKINNMNKSKLNINNENKHDWVSMIYYPNDKKEINLNKEFRNCKKDIKNNLKIVEQTMKDKLNSMKNLIQIKNINENDNFDNYFETNNNSSKFNVTNSYHSNLSNPKSKRNSINSINEYKNKKRKSSMITNKKFTRSHSLFNASNNKNSNINSNTISSHLNQTNFHANINKNSNYKSEILNNPFDQFQMEKIKKINKDKLRLTDFKFVKKYKKIRESIKSLNQNNENKDKARVICRIKPLYDSFDDDESEKEDQNDGDTIIQPKTQIIFFFDLFVFLSSVYCLFYIPLRMVLVDCFCGKEGKINIIILFFIDLLYIADLCIGFFRGYYNYQLKLIKNSHRIVIHYLKTDFCADFLQAIPIFTYSYYLCKSKKEANYCFKYNMSNSLIILKILTNLKIFKIFKSRNKRKNIFYSFIFNVLSENYFFEKLIGNILDFLFVFFIFHFFVCLNIFLSKQSYPNWLIINNSEDKPLIYNYILSSYSLIETLTTVGYGDVVCQSQLERIFQIFFLGVGTIAYSYIISSFGNLIKNESQSSINYNNNLKILEEIRVDYPKMTYKLYNKIYHYIEQRNMAEKKSDTNLLTNSLPFNLKNALLLVMYQTDIRNFNIFKNCENSNFIVQVLSHFVPSTSKKFEFLVYEGEMIEDIIIIKDGRLSLEAAIDMEDPENSIRKYFNVNFQGITTAKEIKKLKELQKHSTSQLIQTKNTKDFDNAKNVLSKVVKKQANYLFNEACDDASILDRTKNEIPNENKNIQLIPSESDLFKHEPIKNEKGNYKYIKIIDIRKNENYGGLYMFMRRPSPLSLKVKSKFAELYLLPKKEVFNIAKSFNNIWSKIHKKDFHNMLSIKHQTFNILNKYIEINGIIKISPNDMSRYIYPWEDPKKNYNKNYINTEENYDNKSIDKNYFKNNMCSSPKSLKRNLSLNRNIENKNSIKGNNYKLYNSFSNKSLDITSSPNYCSQNPVPTEVDFSNLLTLMANEKQKINININNNVNLNNNININNNLNLNNNNTNNSQNINNNLTSNYNIYKNTDKNNNTHSSNERNQSSSSLNSNFFNKEQRTKKSYEEGNTFILHNNSERLLHTLNSVFSEKKAEIIKEEMKKKRKKENRKKIFSFGKKTAELFRNQNYSIFLVGNETNECINIKSNINSNSSKSLFKYDENDKNGISNYISFCQDQLFLDKISEITSSEEDSYHRFDKKNLSQEVAISFSLESIYKNINIHTNLKYSQNKNLQEKTLNFLSRLIENKNQFSSSFSQSSESSQSCSFNNYFSKKHEKKSDSSISSKLQKTQDISLSNSFVNSEILYENSKYRPENSRNLKKQNVNSLNKRIDKNNGKLYNSLFSKYTDGESNNDHKNFAFKSVKPKHINFDNIKNKNKKKNAGKSSKTKEDNKITIKLDLINDESSAIDFNNNVNSNHKAKSKDILSSIERKVNYNLNIKPTTNTNCLSLFGDGKINNIKTVKNIKGSNRLNLNISKRKSHGSDIKSENKASTIKGKYTKKFETKKSKINNKASLSLKNKNHHQPNKFKSEQKLLKIDPKKDEGGIRNSMAYFAKEEKEDCIII